MNNSYKPSIFIVNMLESSLWRITVGIFVSEGRELDHIFQASSSTCALT